jgi:primosomal protein N' (replication factor Y)
MSDYRFADILVPVPLVNKFTYRIPSDIADRIKPGHRVLVNFGKRKQYNGIVVALHNNDPEVEAKPILEAPDSSRFVTEKQTQLWKWMANYYCCSEGEVLRAAIPSNLIPSSESNFYYNVENDYQSDISDSENKIISFLQNSKLADINMISEATELKNPLKYLQSLQEKGIIFIDQQLTKVYKPSFRNYIRFSNKHIDDNIEEYEKLVKRASRQKDVIDYLIICITETGEEFVEIEERLIIDKLNISKSSLASLAKKGLIEAIRKEISRFVNEEQERHNSPVLSNAQKIAFDLVKEGFENNQPVLLHGVTSSGKTEIYIRLIEETLSRGKQVLYMMPEIALTAQMINRLSKHFGNKIGVYHSRHTLNVRSEIYKKLLNHEKDIILGVRSSVFLPFDNLGLIIVDEEHENSYKQHNPDPRYNARDMAIVMSYLQKSNIVMGSATPSIESYSNAKNGKYKLVELTTRYGDVALPIILIADIKDAYRRKIMQLHFHPILIDEINTAISNKEQVILFQNRRGFSPYLECKECGWVPHCSNCNVSLTYHKFKNVMVCHYCGEKYKVSVKCESCGSPEMTTKGLGTQRIEDEVTSLFPDARVARLDYDTANSRKRFEKIISDFENYKTDILIGTQMITKGLDFERLSLVGILNADNMLNFPDFRAFERSFQLFAQVSGRAGRRSKQGKVIIQTYNPGHNILKQVLVNDYLAMFETQIDERTHFRYPPVWNFVIVKLKNKNKEKVYKAAEILSENLRRDFFQRVIGPQEPLINRISNYYILNIHIRFEKSLSAVKIKKSILENVAVVKKQEGLGSTIFEIDVDPI